MTTETPPQETQVVGPTLASIAGALMALSGRLENERQWILQRANDMAKRVLEAERERDEAIRMRLDANERWNAMYRATRAERDLLLRNIKDERVQTQLAKERAKVAEAELAEWRNSIATEKLNERITELEAENEKLRANQHTGQFIHGDGV